MAVKVAPPIFFFVRVSNTSYVSWSDPQASKRVKYHWPMATLHFGAALSGAPAGSSGVSAAFNGGGRLAACR
ncbi:hypothetical protein HOK021_41650 [Streptomyces hygroscopicus]|nr:hypothetical protein HOK021_41650 [Streptomyces hygroscopicus]